MCFSGIAPVILLLYMYIYIGISNSRQVNNECLVAVRKRTKTNHHTSVICGVTNVFNVTSVLLILLSLIFHIALLMYVAFTDQILGIIIK